MKAAATLRQALMTLAFVGSVSAGASAAPTALPLSAPDTLAAEAQYRRDRELTYNELAYYCSLGSQTPYTLRQRCRDAGMGGRRGYQGGDRSRYSYDELAYKCSLGSQTPFTMRSACRRAGLGGW